MPSTNANYQSVWDIDQLYYQGETDGIVLPGNTTSQTTVILYTHNLGFPPVSDGTWQLSTDTVWRQFNDTSISGGPNLSMTLAITPTTLGFVYTNYNSGNLTVNVRFYVWTDEVNH